MKPDIREATVLEKIPPTESRAVLRQIEPGADFTCSYCDGWVKFQAKSRKNQVICNVYVRGKWDRVEHFHEDCYAAAGQTHGSIIGDIAQHNNKCRKP